MRAVVSAALCAVVSLPSVAWGQAAPQPPQIVVSGMGEVRVAPDRASLTVAVRTQSRTAALASEENARKQRAVIAAVRAKGVAADQVGTSGFDVAPMFSSERSGQAPVIVGYAVSNSLHIELRRVDQVGEIIDAAIGAGANEIGSLSFGIANPDSARRTAVAAAVAKARGDAEAAARAAGGTLGELLELTVMDVQLPQPRPFAMARMAAAVESTPIEPGTESVRATVSVRWRFAAGR